MATSITAPRRLFGRDKVLLSLEERILANNNCRILLTGPSGIGKSELLRELDASLRLIQDRVCLLYEISSPAHSVNDLLSNLAVQLLSQADIQNRQGFREALENAAVQDSWLIGTAALLDAVSIIAPNLKNTTGELLTVIRRQSPRATAERISQAGRDDLLAGFIRLIKALDTTGLHGCVLLDRLEGGSQAVHDAAFALAQNLPSSWATVFAINDEIPEGLRTLEGLQPAITYIGGARERLDPLDVPALESWTKASRGTTGDIDELTRVLENCGGRPLFLKDWVAHLMSEEESKLVLTNRLGDYYQERIKGLSSTARWLLVRLAMLPENSAFQFDFCHQLLRDKSPENPTDATWDVISELMEHNFVERESPSGERFRIVHAVTRNHIFNTLPGSVLQTAASNVINVITRTELPPQSAQDLYTQLVLSKLANDLQAVSRLTLPTAQQLVYLGSYKPALTAYSIGLSAAESLKNPELSMEAVLGIATVHLNTGYYQEALNRLINFETDDMPVHLRSKTKLLRGEILMRLNRYSDSLDELEQAHEMFSDQSNLEGQLAAEKTKNTILRDLGRYDEAVSLGLSLVQRAEEGLTPSPLLAACFQALARSLAFRSDTSEGIAAARRSLEISLSIHSIRTEGNSYLALGEVFRHGNMLDEAIVNYEKAIKIAETIANRDSFLWSSLGLADALLLKGELEKARQVLDQVGEIVRNAASHYPLEHLHWQLSTATVAYVNSQLSDTELKVAAAQYQSLGIRWAEDYVRSVLIDGTPTIAKDM